jgi:hypothetical protein
MLCKEAPGKIWVLAIESLGRPAARVARFRRVRPRSWLGKHRGMTACLTGPDLVAGDWREQRR